MGWLRLVLPWLFMVAVILSWDASPTAGVVGYKVYAGMQSNTLVFVRDVGNVLTATIEGTEPRYFAVTAYDGDGHESGYSNIVQSAAKPDKIQNFRFEIK